MRLSTTLRILLISNADILTATSTGRFCWLNYISGVAAQTQRQVTSPEVVYIFTVKNIFFIHDISYVEISFIFLNLTLFLS